MQAHYLPGLSDLLENRSALDSQASEIIETIFVAAFKEAVKQTSSNCLPRAMMMLKIFETLAFVWKKSNSSVQRLVEEINSKKNKELEKIRENHEVVVRGLNLKIEEISSQVEKISKTKDLLENETMILRKHLLQSSQSLEKSKNDRNPPQLRAKVFKSIYIQTDEIPSDSEDSSSEEEVKVPQINNSEKVISRQNTKLIEKKTEQILYLKTKLQSFGCSNTFDPEALHGYISKEFCDFYAWVDGFRVASDYFKTENFEKKVEENVIQDVPVSIPISLTQPLPRSEDKKRSLKENRQLTFKLRNNMTVAQHITENSPIEYILEHLSQQSSNKIKKLTNMTYNKLSMQISNYMNLCLSKGLDSLESYPIFVYTEMFQKYSIKQFANRKFKSLAACCIKHSSSSKAQIFLRMIGGGQCISLASFNLFECKLILKFYEFMFNDKTGIISEAGSIETIFYPTIRALECTKLLEGLIPKHQIAKLNKSIEEMSKSDPELINSKGLIDIHAFILESIQSYQDYMQEVLDSIQLAAKSINEENCFTLGEVHLLIRNISKRKTPKKIDLDSGIDLDQLSSFCISKKLLKIEEVSNFFNEKFEINIQTVQNTKEKISEILETLKNPEKTDPIITLTLDEWESKLDDVILWSKGKKSQKAEKLWKLLSSEFNFLTSSLKIN
jgi:TolA-binding protein